MSVLFTRYRWRFPDNPFGHLAIAFSADTLRFSTAFLRARKNFFFKRKSREIRFVTEIKKTNKNLTKSREKVR